MPWVLIHDHECQSTASKTHCPPLQKKPKSKSQGSRFELQGQMVLCNRFGVRKWGPFRAAYIPARRFSFHVFKERKKKQDQNFLLNDPLETVGREFKTPVKPGPLQPYEYVGIKNSTSIMRLERDSQFCAKMSRVVSKVNSGLFSQLTNRITRSRQLFWGESLGDEVSPPELTTGRRAEGSTRTKPGSICRKKIQRNLLSSKQHEVARSV